MATEHKGEYLKDKKVDGKLLKDLLPEGELIVSEGPKGEKLWKKKKKLNEDGSEVGPLNEG
jgi:hypothetical protein